MRLTANLILCEKNHNDQVSALRAARASALRGRRAVGDVRRARVLESTSLQRRPEGSQRRNVGASEEEPPVLDRQRHNPLKHELSRIRTANGSSGSGWLQSPAPPL